MKIILHTERTVRSVADLRAYCEALVLDAKHPPAIIAELLSTDHAEWVDGEVTTTYEIVRD